MSESGESSAEGWPGGTLLRPQLFASERDRCGRPSRLIFVGLEEFAHVDDQHVVLEPNAETVHVARRAAAGEVAGRLLPRARGRATWRAWPRAPRSPRRPLCG